MGDGQDKRSVPTSVNFFARSAQKAYRYSVITVIISFVIKTVATNKSTFRSTNATIPNVGGFTECFRKTVLTIIQSFLHHQLYVDHNILRHIVQSSYIDHFRQHQPIPTSKSTSIHLQHANHRTATRNGPSAYRDATPFQCPRTVSMIKRHGIFPCP